MEPNTGFKGTIAIVVFLSYLMNAAASILLVTAFSMVADFLSGALAAIILDTFSFKQAKDGFIRKSLYPLLISISFGLDFIVYCMTKQMGIEVNTRGIFGMCMCVWVFCTEGLSVAKNVSKAGLVVPAFFIQTYSRIRKTVETTQEVEVKESEETK